MKKGLLLFLLFGMQWLRAAAWEQRVNTDNRRVILRFSSMLDSVPSKGFVPVRIHLHNRSTLPSSWDFRFSTSHNWNMDQNVSRISVRADLDGNQERVLEVLVPVQPSGGHGSSSPRLHVSISGPGINNNAMHLFDGSGGWRSDKRFYAMSRGLTARNKDALVQAIAGGGGGESVATLSIEDLSEDVRAYSGLDAVILRESEWNALERNMRYVMRQWVARGGQLLLAAEAGERPPLDLEGWSGKGIELGWGSIQPLKLEGELLDAAYIRSISSGFTGAFPVEHGDSYQRLRWQLRQRIPNLDPPLALLFLFVIVIAVLLGPVNVITAFRAKNPVRLLWVTPVASVILSLLLVIGILMVDGFGGYGHRALTVFLMPSDNLEVLTQEQVSRTGVLLRRSFTVAPGTVMLPVNTENNQGIDGNFTLTGQEWDGDWFRSRSMQGQLLQASRPSRSRLEVIHTVGGAQIFSELDAHLEKLYLRDSQGRYWKAEDLHAGQRKALASATQQEARAFVDTLQLRNGERVMPLRGDGCFIARAAPRREAFLPSYGAIRWREEHLRYTGTFLERSAP